MKRKQGKIVTILFGSIIVIVMIMMIIGLLFGDFILEGIREAFREDF
ncbi:hypothetical protein [Jeotgalibacillus proteolyticus]|nr:hypothetical protein [Jeotgalibacillus proteolyticus]